MFVTLIWAPGISWRPFVWVEVAGVRVYSCYFSPGDPFDVFETQILLLEESLREAFGRSLIGGDFNR